MPSLANSFVAPEEKYPGPAQIRGYAAISRKYCDRGKGEAAVAGTLDGFNLLRCRECEFENANRVFNATVDKALRYHFLSS
jgi:hypothetical protein